MSTTLVYLSSARPDYAPDAAQVWQDVTSRILAGDVTNSTHLHAITPTVGTYKGVPEESLMLEFWGDNVHEVQGITARLVRELQQECALLVAETRFPWDTHVRRNPASIGDTFYSEDATGRYKWEPDHEATHYAGFINGAGAVMPL